MYRQSEDNSRNIIVASIDPIHGIPWIRSFHVDRNNVEYVDFGNEPIPLLSIAISKLPITPRSPFNRSWQTIIVSRVSRNEGTDFNDSAIDRSKEEKEGRKETCKMLRMMESRSMDSGNIELGKILLRNRLEIISNACEISINYERFEREKNRN